MPIRASKRKTSPGDAQITENSPHSSSFWLDTERISLTEDQLNGKSLRIDIKLICKMKDEIKSSEEKILKDLDSFSEKSLNTNKNVYSDTISESHNNILVQSSSNGPSLDQENI